MILTTVILLFILLALYFWYSSFKVHEAAKEVAYGLCQARGWQLLDDSVALKKMSFSKSSNSKRVFLRHYEFEYAQTNGERHIKRILMHGYHPAHKADAFDNVINFPNIKRGKK